MIPEGPGASSKSPMVLDREHVHDMTDLRTLRRHVTEHHAGQALRGRKPPRRNADLIGWHWGIHYRLHLSHIHGGPWIQVRVPRSIPSMVKPLGYWTGAQMITRAELARQWRERHAVPAEGVVRDTDGTILRGPSLVCGCPLDSGCTGYHPGRLA